MEEIPNRLPSILLARKPLFTANENDTTATVKSKAGYLMAVSFWMADPPALSLYSIHCSKPPDLQHKKISNFWVMPRVVGADGPLVLLRAAFYARSGGRPEYFLYTAGEPPSLELIPSPNQSDGLRHRELGILCRGGDYFVADLRHAPSKTKWSEPESDDGYQLRIYSSKTKSWSTRRLPNPCPGVDRVIPDKVITLGQEGLLGFVDLSHGLLVCDLLLLLHHQKDQDPPVPGAVSYIPLPPPLPRNRYKLIYPNPPHPKDETNPSADKASHSASWFRDLACVNGVLKLVEMENLPPPENNDHIIFDSDSIMFLKRKASDGNSMQRLSSFRDSWRAVTWTRKVSPSSNFWRQTSSAPFADIKGRLPDQYSAYPIISLNDDGDDINLYLKSMEDFSYGAVGRVVALDIGNMEQTGVAPYYLPNGFDNHPVYDHEHPFRVCTVSHHLNMTPGTHVSVCHEITMNSSSANQPRKTSMERLSELAGKIKRPRIAAAKSVTQNDHISQVRNPAQRHKWEAPPKNSLWPHQNNLPPQQCFNKPIGPYGPGYASLAPVHGGHNYQPLWLPSKHLLTSSSELKPHEAPQPCFDYSNVASYHRYSQQLSTPNSFAYGAHTSYSNYQQQWQQWRKISGEKSWDTWPGDCGESGSRTGGSS